jgi:hypothetical protein
MTKIIQRVCSNHLLAKPGQINLRIKKIELQMQNNIKQDEFQPKGAIAFFILLVVLGLLIWFGIYFLMLQRN